jgi:LysM repeat protein
MRKLALVLLLLLAFGAVTFAQTAGEVSHVVQRGETIYSISRAYGVTMDAILIRNNIIDPNRIVAGQVLIIPTGAVTVPWVHVVEPGETLYSIAIRYNTTVDAIIATASAAAPLPLGKSSHCLLRVAPRLSPAPTSLIQGIPCARLPNVLVSHGKRLPPITTLPMPIMYRQGQRL